VRFLYLIGALFSLLAFANQTSFAATIAPCVPNDPVGSSSAQTCTLYELAPGDDGIPLMQELLFPTLTGYLILCSTGCDSGTPQTDTSQWSDVVAFQRGLNADQPFVQIFPAPFSQDFLTMMLPCITLALSPCVLPDGTPTFFFLTRFQKKQPEVRISTGMKAIFNSPGGPGCCGTNVFNIVSAAAPEPETWNLLVLGITALAIARGLRCDH